jgi:predicted alpha/beta hydrolase
MVTTRPLVIPLGEGSSLAATLFTPPIPADSAVLIAGGLGVPQRFYSRMARWLAGRGHCVLSFDPRGIGASLALAGQSSPARTGADLLSWARIDFSAAVDALLLHSGQPDIALLGHSLGVHHAAMGTAQTQQRIRKVVSVAAGSGYWRDWAPASRRWAPIMLHLAIPLLTPAFGYFPGQAIGMVGNLPAGVAHQWASWCRHPEFAWGAEPEQVSPSLATARFPVHAFSFSDDDAMTEVCTRKLMQAMPHASSQIEVVRPAQVQMAAIGHVGAFRPDGAAQLWPRLEAALMQRTT